MTDWVGTARSNYFEVKDEVVFRDWANDNGLEVVADDKGRFAILGDPHGFGRFNDEDYECHEHLAPHLKDGHVAVLIKAGGAESYLASGRSVAVNSKGESVSFWLSDIYDRAEGLGDKITRAEG